MQYKEGSNRKGQGGFRTLARTSAILRFLPHTQNGNDINGPRRKSLEAPVDKETFIKPLKQCFIKNPRTMPMTRIMISLLAGWAGQGTAIETTIGIIAKHLGRCRRQVFRYLKDAEEEGYLYYSRTKDRIGRYTGIKVYLNFAAIRFTKFERPKKRRKSAKKLDVTHLSDTNTKSYINKENDEAIAERLQRLATALGFEDPIPIPI